MSKPETTWNHRPVERGEGFCSLDLSLTLCCRDQAQRDALDAALHQGQGGEARRLHGALADAMGAAAEDALAARLMVLGPARLNRDGIFLFAHLGVEPARPTWCAVSLRVEVGSYPRWLREGGPERPRNERLLEGIARVLDEPGSGAAVAAAVDEVFYDRVKPLGGAVEGFAWKVRYLGQTP